MTLHTGLSDDAAAIAMLCTALGLPRGDAVGPLSPGEWNRLELSVRSSEWQRPGNLLGKGAQELQRVLGMPGDQAERVAYLLDRGGAFALTLSQLEDMGIWMVTRADDAYPQRLLTALNEKAPPVLLGAGERSLLHEGGIAVAGSRGVGEAGSQSARRIGELAARDGKVLISGAARGVDRIAMNAAVEAGGVSVGVLADSLSRAVRDRETRALLANGSLCLITQNHPDAPFSVGIAMGRNKLIYTLAEYAIVVECDREKGGTWAGAMENLKAGWVPLFVLTGTGIRSGNEALIRKGAVALEMEALTNTGSLRSLLKTHAPDSAGISSSGEQPSGEGSFFGMPFPEEHESDSKHR